MSVIALLHFVVGCGAVIAGFTSLLVKKGSTVHKQSGRMFMVTMLLLSLSGFYLSYARELQFTFLLSAFALYLVVTGWLAVWHSARDRTHVAKCELTFSVLLCLTCFACFFLGTALNWSPPETEPPYGAYAFIGVCVSLFMLGDIKWLKKGQTSEDNHIHRHLTRVGSSMLLATTVFFLGNNHVLPESMRTVTVLLTPIFSVIVITLFYRFTYLRFRKGT